MDVISALEMSATLGETNGSSSLGNNKNRKKYYYYTVDAAWFRRAWPYLNAIRVDPQDPVSPTWKEDLGPISSDTTSSTATSQPPQHPTDFVVVGANVWLLLSHKFGVADHNHTHTFKRPVVRHNHQTLVRVSETVSVEIPPSGRFPYEQFVQQMPPPVPPPPPPPPSNEDEEDDLVRCTVSSSRCAFLWFNKIYSQSRITHLAVSWHCRFGTRSSRVHFGR